MQYIVNRTSAFDMSPCDGCETFKLEKYKDIRVFANHEEWKKRFPNDFKCKIYESGVTKDGNPYILIDSRIDEYIYVKEIEDLREFASRHGSIILSPPDERHYGFENLFKIEIYDYYRE